MGRVSDVKKIVTKDFKRAGNRLLLLGHHDASTLGGTVYADAHGQRGDRLFDGYDAGSMRVQWNGLLELHAEGLYVSASSIAEGGLLLRVFESAFGSGLGGRVDLHGVPAAQRDGLLFGEFIGACLLEVPPNFELPAHLVGLPHQFIGHVTAEPRLTLADGENAIWDEAIAKLAESWSETFREVVK
jgi:phosphoribosylformylglycinamidine (FGAM) synthase-like enzyme